LEILLSIQQSIRDVLLVEFGRYAAAKKIAILFWLAPLGIVFGAVHALTPGHSKMVLASYVLGSRLSALRSLSVSIALAFVHVASAVVIALAASWLVKRTLAGAGRASSLEILSGITLALLGIWLLWRGIRKTPHVHNEGIWVGFAAGLIPCPLTLFTMFLAQSRGVPELGYTFCPYDDDRWALTSIVAMATAFARDRLLVLAERHGNSVTKLARGLDILTGLLLIAGGIGRAFS